MSKILLSMFSSMIFMVSGLTFKSLIHFECILVFDVIRWPSFIFLQISVQFSLSEENQNTYWKEYIHPYVHCSIIYNSQDLERAQVPISRWVDKKAVVRLHMEYYYSAIKKMEILPFVTAWIDLENIMLSEISQRKKNTIWFHLHVESKKQNKWKRTNKTEIQIKTTMTYYLTPVRMAIINKSTNNKC